MAAVGTVTSIATALGGGITKYAIAWTSDAAGAVSGTAITVKYGELRQVKFVPGSAADQPTDQYDMTITDASGVDVLAGTGANLSNANAKISVPLFGDGTTSNQKILLESGDLTPVISAAGNAKSGTVILYVFG